MHFKFGLNFPFLPDVDVYLVESFLHGRVCSPIKVSSLPARLLLQGVGFLLHNTRHFHIRSFMYPNYLCFSLPVPIKRNKTFVAIARSKRLSNRDM